jgi:hypothetical protein
MQKLSFPLDHSGKQAVSCTARVNSKNKKNVRWWWATVLPAEDSRHHPLVHFDQHGVLVRDDPPSSFARENHMLLLFPNI